MAGNEASVIPTQPEFFMHVGCGYGIRKNGPFIFM